jgi:hypothetical protein
MAASGGTSFEPGTSSLSETLTVTWATGPL